jgi:hypothetical protein
MTQAIAMEQMADKIAADYGWSIAQATDEHGVVTKTYRRGLEVVTIQ